MPTTLPEVAIGLELPPDGSYPPRIVGPGYSAWLRLGEIGLEEPGIFTVCNFGQKCEITQLDPLRQVMVNGQPLVGRRVLRDGDFIHTKETRGIFQQDPVADYSRYWQGSPLAPRHIRLTITPQLQKYVLIDAHGFSLNAGKNVTPWTHFAGLVFQLLGDGKWRAMLFEKHEGKPSDKMPTKLGAILSDEADMLTKWAQHSAPYEISTLSVPALTDSDAYRTIAHTKIIDPARENKRLLPMSIAVILGLPTRKDTLLKLMLRAGFAALIASLLSGNANFHPVLFVIIMAFALLGQFRGIGADLRYLRELTKYETLERPMP
jgi:hypothetical protein